MAQVHPDVSDMDVAFTIYWNGGFGRFISPPSNEELVGDVEAAVQ
jgi:hypothetical protein